MQGEFAVTEMVFQRRFLLINPVHSLRFHDTATSVIIHEHVLLQDIAHIKNFVLPIRPVESGRIGDEDFSFCRSHEQIRLHVPEGVTDKPVEAVVNRHYYDEGSRADSHADSTRRGDDVYHIM